MSYIVNFDYLSSIYILLCILKNTTSALSDSAQLRQKAEAKLKKDLPGELSALSASDALKLIQELRVHQVELEMQNEELRRIMTSGSEANELTHKMEVFQCELEAQNEELLAAIALAQDATDLYDFAPTGYFALSVEGEILRLNYSGAEILGKDRSQLVNNRFAFFVSDDTRPVFNLFLESVFNSKIKQSCETTLLTSGEAPIYVHITGVLTGNAEYCLATVTDISGRKQAEMELNDSRVFLDTIIEQSPNSLWISDKRGTLMRMNQACRNNLHLKDEEVVNKYNIFKDSNLENQVSMPMIRDVFEKGTTARFEIKYDTARVKGLKLNQKVMVDLDVHITPVLDSNGKVTNAIIQHSDITERKRAEEALLKSKQQFEKLAANIPVGSYILHSKPDGSFKLDYASSRMTEMLGLDRESLLKDARLIYETIYTDDRAGFAELNEKGISLKQPFDWKGRICAGGKIKWMHFSSSPELQVDGDIMWHGLIVDITKEKLAEDEINEAHNRLLKIAGRVPGVVYQFKLRPDGTSCFPYSSEGIREIYGVSPQEVINDASKAFANIHNDDYAGVLASIQVSAKELSPWTHEYRVKCTDGSIRTVWGNSLPQMEDDGSVLWHGFINDITERKQREQNLKESEARFKNLFELHSAIMLLIDPVSGLIIDVNDAAVKFYGYSKTVLQSMKIEELNVLSGEQVKAERDKARINNLNYFVFQHRLASGEDRTVEVHSSPIDFQEKQILFSIIHDITERKIAENEIQIKNEELLKVNAEKDKFFSIIAHDLRGPIGSFMGLTERMAEGIADMTLDDLQNIARVMKKSASNLYNLLGNLLEWSRMQRGLTTFEPVTFLLMPKILENIIQASDSASKKAIAITTGIPGDLVVFADENMLACIIRNMVANAVKFTPDGGEISISARPLDDGKVEISISDNGIGMSKDLIENLFSLDVNTSRKGTGGELSTGLGLMICKDFIEKHGGEIKVVSEVGKGSRFSFSIPAAGLEK